MKLGLVPYSTYCPAYHYSQPCFHIPCVPSWHGAMTHWNHCLFSFYHSYDALDYCYVCSTMGLTCSQACQLCTQLSVVFPVDQWTQISPWLFRLGLETLHGRTDVALVLEHNTSVFEASTVNNFQILCETLLYRVKISYWQRENMRFSEKCDTVENYANANYA